MNIDSNTLGTAHQIINTNHMLSPTHMHNNGPNLRHSADSTQSLNNMLNRLSFSAGPTTNSVPASSNQNTAFSASPSISSSGISSNSSLNYIIKIRNIPNDITLREAHLMFSLLQGGIIDIDVIQENNSGDRAIKVLLNSLNVALSTARILDSKTSLFGPGFPYKSFVQLFDVQSQQEIAYNNKQIQLNNAQRASASISQFPTENAAQHQQQVQSISQQEQVGLFSFVDPFNSVSANRTNNNMTPHQMASNSQTTKTPVASHINTSILQNTQDLMASQSPYEERSFFYDNVSNLATTAANSTSNIWNNNASDRQNSIFLTSANDDESNGMSSVPPSASKSLSAQPELSISSSSTRAPEWSARSSSIYNNVNSNSLNSSPSAAFKGSMFGNTATHNQLEVNFMGSPLSSKVRDDLSPNPQLAYPNLNNSVKQNLSPTSKVAQLASVKNSPPVEVVESLSNISKGTPQASIVAQKKVSNAFASINGMTEEDIHLLSRVPAPANPADQNPPCNTLYVGNLPPDATEQELRQLFSIQRGFRRLSFRNKNNGNNHGPMCFVEFEDVIHATRALATLYGTQLPRNGNNSHHGNKGGIRLSFSKNPLGVRSSISAPSNSSTGGSFRRSIASSASNAPVQSVLSPPANTPKLSGSLSSSANSNVQSQLY